MKILKTGSYCTQYQTGDHYGMADWCMLKMELSGIDCCSEGGHGGVGVGEMQIDCGRTEKSKI